MTTVSDKKKRFNTLTPARILLKENERGKLLKIKLRKKGVERERKVERERERKQKERGRDMEHRAGYM